MKPADHAQGKWASIIAAHVGEQYTNTRKNQACPKTGDAGKGTGRFRFSNIHGNGGYFCSCSDGSKDGFDLLQCFSGCDFKEAMRKVESVIGECQKDETYKPLPPTAAELLRSKTRKVTRSKYLESRGLEIPDSLEWIEKLGYFDDEGKKVATYSAMLAPVTRQGRFLTYHATYLQSGAKAPVDTVRKMMPGPRMSGGAVELYPLAKEIGIGEGIETCIAAKMLFSVPTWAALNTSLLMAWEPPQGVESVLIFADHDANYAGSAAAYALAHKLYLKGIKVTVEMPPILGQDWNDVLLSTKALA